MWVARDKNGTLWLYDKKPRKKKRVGCWSNDTAGMMRVFKPSFPKVKWEDEEPTEVELTIKHK